MSFLCVYLQGICACVWYQIVSKLVRRYTGALNARGKIMFFTSGDHTFQGRFEIVFDSLFSISHDHSNNLYIVDLYDKVKNDIEVVNHFWVVSRKMLA